jgi:hypothetical protein
VITIRLKLLPYILCLAWKLSFVCLSFNRELDYAPSYLEGLPVQPLNPKTCLNEVGLSDTIYRGVIFYYSMCFSFKLLCC